MSGLGEDFRFATRMLRKYPATSAAAVLALAVGIGLNTAVYSVADALVFRPLPMIADIDRVVWLYGREISKPEQFRSVSATDYTDLRDRARTLESVGVFRYRPANLTGAGEPESIITYAVTPSFFTALQLRPIAGRAFLAEEETPGKNRTVILGHAVWRKNFGMDPGVLGRDIELDGAKYRVVGILPEGFNFPNGAAAYTPLALTGQELSNAGNFYLGAVARMWEGQTLESVNAEVAALYQRIAKERPDSHSSVTVAADLLRTNVSGKLTHVYTSMMMAAVGFLLLIACANVANLQLAKILSRTREMAVRAALGASRIRIVRQILVESLLVSLGGALVGLLLAFRCLDLMRASMPPEVQRFLPGWYRISLDRNALLWTSSVTLLSAFITGLAPALWLSRADPSRGLQGSGRASTANRSRQRLRIALVVSETALSVVLLIGAALIVKGLNGMTAVQSRVPPGQVLTFNLTLPVSRYETDSQVRSMQSQYLERFASLPNVVSASLVSDLPYAGGSSNSNYEIDGQPEEKGTPKQIAQRQTIDGAYFGTLGIPLISGRTFQNGDGPDAPKVVVVSQTLANLRFPGKDPIGKRVRWGDAEWMTIVGVAGDILHNPWERVPQPVMYQPYRQSTDRGVAFVLRTNSDPMSLLPDVKGAIRDLDPAQPVAFPRTFHKVIRDQVTGFAYLASMMTVFGFVALLLSVIGVYSLISFAVGERAREFGVRMALGADRGDLIALVMRGSVWIAALSLLAGWPIAFWLASSLRSFFYGVSSSDPAILFGVPAILTLCIFIAGWIPARRASRTDPVSALHCE
jgi:putative ABC transport system permease protein